MKFFAPLCAMVAGLSLLGVSGNDTAPAATNYVAAFAPANSPAWAPYSGTMRLVVSGDAIAGTYTGTSVQPDRFNNRLTPVTGSFDRSDGDVQMMIGNAMWFTGKMYSDGTISGSAEYAGGIYAFMAKPGTPGGR